MGALDGKRVVVTGSSRGLGNAFASEIAAQGAAVVLNGTDPNRSIQAERELAETGAQVAVIVGSVADEAVCDELVATCVERFGGIDGVVNNAGMVRDRTLVKMSAEEFDDVIAVHLRGAWATSRAAVRVMRESGGGSIVNIVSASAYYGLTGQTNYAAAKGGMLAMTRSLALELAAKDIRVNAVAPVAQTDMTAPMASSDNEELKAFFHPAEEVAPLVSYLLCDDAAHITAQNIGFNGREITMWSHPQPKAQATRDRWDAADIGRFLNAQPTPLESIHVDGLGDAVHRAMGLQAPKYE